MKKTFAFLFALNLLFAVVVLNSCNQKQTENTEAATEENTAVPNETETVATKGTDTTSTVKQLTQYIITIVVKNRANQLVQGAIVALPCSGLPNQTTNNEGRAVFQWNDGSCTCVGTNAYVTHSPSGCAEMAVPINVNCNTTYNAKCPR